jgi:hypothetical protein
MSIKSRGFSYSHHHLSRSISQLSAVVYLFSKNVHDSTLPLAVQG